MTKVMVTDFFCISHTKRSGLQGQLGMHKKESVFWHLSFYPVLNFGRKTALYHFKVKAEGQRKGKHLALKMKVITILAGRPPNHPAR